MKKYEKNGDKMKPYALFETDRMIDDGDYIIYYATALQSLFRVNKTTGNTELIWKNSGNDIFRSFIRYNNKYIFFPENFGRVGVLNPFQDEIKYLNIPKDLHLPRENNWSGNYIKYKDSLFFYWQNPVVTRYDILTNKWTIYRNWKEELPVNISTNHWMIRDAFICKEKIYFFIGDSKYFLEINLKNNDANVCCLDLPDNINGIQNIRYIDEHLFLLCKNKNNNISILKNNFFLSKNFEEITQLPILVNTDELFISIVCGKEYLWLFPCSYNKAYKINLRTNEYKICSEIPVYNNTESEYNYVHGQDINNSYWTININTGELIKIDLSNDKVVNIQMKLSLDIYIKLLKNTNVFYESGWNFKDLINKLIINDGGVDQNDAIPDNFFNGNDYGNFDNVVSSCVKKQCVKKDIKSKYDLSQYNEDMGEDKNRRKWDFLFF